MKRFKNLHKTGIRVNTIADAQCGLCYALGRMVLLEPINLYWANVNEAGEVETVLDGGAFAELSERIEEGWELVGLSIVSASE